MGITNKPNINKNKIIEFKDAIIDYLFPNYFHIVTNIEELEKMTRLYFQYYISKNENHQDIFFSQLNDVYLSILTDIEMTFLSDPSCNSMEEVLITYPGIYAIIHHRIAHILYNLDFKIEARIISEYAHSKTGIDIHPGASIKDYFFIDHGTGVVIGETCLIGHHVKIYQGVTLGAISLAKGQKMKGKKRHPTIGNYVTIYSNASILGGDTFIGDRTTIGCNVFITETIKENLKVMHSNDTLIIKEK